MKTCGWFLKKHNVSKIYLCCSMYFTAEYYSSVCHILFLQLIHSSIDGHLECLYFLTTMNNAKVNTYTSFLWTYSWTYAFWVELLGHVIAVYWPALGTAKLFSKVVVPVFIPANNTWGFQLLSIVCNTCYCLSFFFFFYCLSL